MAARSIWKGSLKLSLISIPVRLFPATREGADVSFHQFHRKCHTRIQLKKWCPHCEEELTSADIIKGHEAAKGRVVFVESDEIKQLKPESSQTIAVSDVVSAAAIDPRYVERVYYLAPDSKDAGSAFAVVREALAEKAAIGRLSMHGREYLVAVLPDGEAMLVYTLRTAGEVRSRDEAANLQFTTTRVKPEEVRLAKRVLESFKADADLSQFTDHYQDALRALLKKKGATTVVEDEAEPARGAKVVNLMDALRRSVEAAKTGAAKQATTSRRTTRSGRPPARVVKHPGRPKVRRAG